ncbi:MAG TPA: antitoxin [Solirubrobacteraceae bacterium]|jgi:hypothetical protein|nr:antitoxin [Solirubrobacteraceae bacterium]
MAFGDKFKDLAKQAQDAVAERKEKITGAVDRAGVAADARTGGKYSDKIAKVSQKAEQVVEKLSGDREAGAEPGSAAAEGAPGPADGAPQAAGPAGPADGAPEAEHKPAPSPPPDFE